MRWRKCFIISIISLFFFTKTSAKTPKKIMGGTQVNVRDYPYVVSVQYLETHFCGGSILNSNYVVTAANCVTLDNNILVANLKLKMGTSDLFDPLNPPSIDVSYIIYHQKFNQEFDSGNDIALLKLVRPILFSTNLYSIDLPIIYLLSIKKLEIAGWGDLNSNSIPYTASRYLHALQLNNNHPEKCMELYKDFGESLAFNFRSGRIGCASTRSKQQDITLGDGGNGLILNDRIVGIVSLHTKKKNLIIFTKIFRHRQWIESVMKNVLVNTI